MLRYLCLRRYSFAARRPPPAARPSREGLRPPRDPAAVHLDEDDNTEE